MPPSVRALLVGAGVYATGLIVAGFLAPMYEGETVTTSGTSTRESATLVEVNGLNVMFVLGIPLAITIAVAAALSRRTDRGTRVAWVLTGALAAFNLLAMMSIGVFVLPVTAALVAACWVAQRRDPSTAP